MIFAKSSILKWIKPFIKENVGAGSVDLTLANEFWIPKNDNQVILNERIDFKKYFVKKNCKEIVLEPGAFILGITKEKIELPEDVAGLLNGRSRFARFGLMVHATSSYVQPGVSNRQVFEIKNISNRSLVLKEGLRIGQIIFIKCEGEGKYKGSFAKQ